MVKYKGRYAEATSRYGPKPNVQEAVQAYADLAAACGMSLTELAIRCGWLSVWHCVVRQANNAHRIHRFVLTNPLVSSALTGATTVDQLLELVAAASKGPLDAEVMAAVDRVHWRYPNPTP